MTKQHDEKREGLGDDQGTRVGKPEPGRSGSLGAGAEASEGIHGANGAREPGDQSSLEGRTTGRENDGDSASDPAGSEPLSRSTEHRSGYGGSGGAPVSSSDQREETNKR